MIRYTTSVPLAYHNDFEGYLYNRNPFLSLKEGGCTSFYALDDIRRAVVAQIRFRIYTGHPPEGLQAISLPHSPFGSLEFSDVLDKTSLQPFIGYLLSDLKERQVQWVEIRHYAAAYDPVQTEVVFSVLYKAGFHMVASASNHHIEVDENPLEHKMHPWEVRKLKKCRSSGFSFREEPLHKLRTVYEFIQQCRESQGRALSLTGAQLERFISTMPQAYDLFAVYDKSRIIAAAITVRVSKRILYTFYYAASAVYNTYSPTVRLLEGIYQFCQEKNMIMMDLGTSPSDAVRNFKSQMGGIISDKRSFGLIL